MIVRSPEEFVRHVVGEGVWHTTSPARFQRIQKDGAVRVEPEISDQERHKTAAGPSHYPFVRSTGGVSLFDFRDFAPRTYSDDYALSNREAFVPTQPSQKKAYWLQFDSARLGNTFLDGKNLLALWKDEQAYRHTIMPEIEAAHFGDLDLSTATNILLVAHADRHWVINAIQP